MCGGALNVTEGMVICECEYCNTKQTVSHIKDVQQKNMINRANHFRQNGEFVNLKGLIYFTDGYGEFPAKKPDYDTAFVFVDDDYNNPDVPTWAIKLVLQRDEI